MRQGVKDFIKIVAGPQRYFKLQASYLDMKMKKNKDLYKKIQENKRFKDIHKGQRCFILGNGPSLRTVDLQRLDKEIIFTVNFFNKTSDFEKVSMKYHLWIDAAFFDMRDDVHLDMEDVMESYRKISEKGAICFIPDYGYSYVKNKKLDKDLDLNYFYMGNALANLDGINIDLCRLVPSFTTVVQYAIYVAIYMGFEEIYLLGCDTTNIVGVIDSVLGKSGTVLHAYDNDKTQKTNTELINNWKMMDVFYDQYILFQGYNTLEDYCRKHDIKLVNCSSPTLVNEVPRKSLAEVLKHI